MSCRAIGRGVENFTLNQVATAARALGYQALLGEFLPTAKNAPVADLFPRLGFAPSGEEGFRLELAEFNGTETFVSDTSPE